MKVLLIQVVLITGVLVLAARVIIGRSARTQAFRRLWLVVLAGLAIWSILFPSVWTRMAGVVGVGRGTDLVLYALVVAFLSFTVTTYLRFRELEARYTTLARRIALDEAPRPGMPPTQPPGDVTAPDPSS